MSRAERGGIGAAVGAAGAALLSTACCWVPLALVLIGAGASSLALTRALESMRWPLVVVAGGLLLWAHWRVYGRSLSTQRASRGRDAQGVCCEEGECTPKRKSHGGWWTHAMLWMATTKVGLLAVYPQAVLALFATLPGHEVAAQGEAEAERQVYRVEGPSLCAGCVPQLEAALRAVEGVAQVRVVLAKGEVEVWWQEGATQRVADLAAAGQGVGVMITAAQR